MQKRYYYKTLMIQGFYNICLGMPHVTAKSLQIELRNKADKKRAKILQRFFKTGVGEYAEGDRFLGVVVPETRKVVKKYHSLSLKETIRLLKSPIHEERLAALLILAHQFKKGDDSAREAIYKTYLRYTSYINNWDLVDVSAERIVGGYLFSNNTDKLYRLASSGNLWNRRIAIMATFHFIKKNKFSDTMKIAKLLLSDEHDLIHKAVGWMLREVGKRDQIVEEKFLKQHYKKMPRTMLRYAIEKFSETKRKAYLMEKV